MGVRSRRSTGDSISRESFLRWSIGPSALSVCLDCMRGCRAHMAESRDRVVRRRERQHAILSVHSDGVAGGCARIGSALPFDSLSLVETEPHGVVSLLGRTNASETRRKGWGADMRGGRERGYCARGAWLTRVSSMPRVCKCTERGVRGRTPSRRAGAGAPTSAPSVTTRAPTRRPPTAVRGRRYAAACGGGGSDISRSHGGWQRSQRGPPRRGWRSGGWRRRRHPPTCGVARASVTSPPLAASEPLPPPLLWLGA